MSDILPSGEPIAAPAPKPNEEIWQAIGRLQSFHFSRQFIDVAMMRLFAEVKADGAYKSAGMTWDQFCLAVGMKRRTVDDALQSYRELGEGLLSAIAPVGLTYKSVATLRRLPKDIRPFIDEGAIVIPTDAGEHRIPVSEESRPLIQNAINQLLDTIEDERKSKVSAERSLKSDIEDKERQIKELRRRHDALEAKLLKSQLPEQAREILTTSTRGISEALEQLYSLDITTLRRDPDAIGEVLEQVGRLRVVLQDIELNINQAIDEV